MDIPSRDPRTRSHIPARHSEPVDVSEMHTTRLQPPSRAGQTPPEAQEKIAWHRAEAALWREQAERLLEPLKLEFNRFAQGVARWQRLAHSPARTSAEDTELATIERDIPAQAESMARSRQRWTACLLAAREHDDDADRLRAVSRK